MNDPTTSKPDFGVFGQLSYMGDFLVCHLCGYAYESLAAHVRQSHGLLAIEYKAMFGLPRKTALWSERLRRIDREHAIYMNRMGILNTIKPGEHLPLTNEHRIRIGEGRRLYLALHPEAKAKLSDISKMGRKVSRRGERSATALLTEAKVSEIRSRYNDGNGEITQTELAKEYGVSRAAIGLVVNNKTWKK